MSRIVVVSGNPRAGSRTSTLAVAVGEGEIRQQGVGLADHPGTRVRQHAGTKDEVALEGEGARKRINDGGVVLDDEYARRKIVHVVRVSG